MLPEFGNLCLCLALLTAIVQGTVPLWGAHQRNTALMAFGAQAALAQVLCLAIAFAVLTALFVQSDFSTLLVTNNSHSEKPMLYKVTGVWGNHEGSMLLWVLILACYGAAVAVFGRRLPEMLKARVLAVQGLIGVGFLSFVIFTSNPFERLFPVPVDGNDLNPLLQDPGLAAHPPFLYLGYVGFSMAYAFAVATLIEGDIGPAWARWVRPWTLLAWTCLTIGIGLGSWWAYYELGWGGFWFWDPVENASLMPWLLGTALLHSAIVVEKRDTLKRWTILLAILTFSLSLLGTFLVRSGVLTSVHAFAVDPERGVVILLLLLIATGGALTLYAWRAPTLSPSGLFKPVSRESALVLNNLILSTMTATVFIGTLYPLFLDAMIGEKVTVGPPYYNATGIPLMVPLVLAMGVAPLLGWKRAELAPAFARLWIAGALCLAIVAVVAWWQKGGPLLALLGVGMGAWAILSALTEMKERTRLGAIPLAESRRRLLGLPGAIWGMVLGHMGIGVVVLGITGGSMWISERIEAMQIGDSVDIAGYTVTLDQVLVSRVDNYETRMAVLRVTRDGAEITTLRPERRWYPVARMDTTEASILTDWTHDLYAAMGEAHENGAFTIRIWHHPLIPWLWAGGVIMVLGGIASLSDRRFRLAPPRRANTVPPPGPPPGPPRAVPAE